MKIVIPNWFQKAEKPKEQSSDKAAMDQQGNYTDHVGSPYEIRMATEPLRGEELEAFNWVLDLMQHHHPEAKTQSQAIEYAIGNGYFYEGKNGELRVSEELP